MARILRGDIIWADLDPTLRHKQAGQHPVLVLSEDILMTVRERLLPLF